MLKVKKPIYTPKKITNMRQKLMKLKVQLKICFLQIKKIKKVYMIIHNQLPKLEMNIIYLQKKIKH